MRAGLEKRGVAGEQAVELLLVRKVDEQVVGGLDVSGARQHGQLFDILIPKSQRARSCNVLSLGVILVDLWLWLKVLELVVPELWGHIGVADIHGKQQAGGRNRRWFVVQEVPLPHCEAAESPSHGGHLLRPQVLPVQIENPEIPL